MPNRVEREIEEILTKLESPGPGRQPVKLRPPSWRTRLRNARRRLPSPSLGRLNAGTMMIWGIALILSALILRLISPELTRIAVIIGLVLFFGSFIVGFLHKDAGSVGSGETYWRGQRVSRRDLRGPSPIDSIKRWLNRRNRGR